MSEFEVGDRVVVKGTIESSYPGGYRIACENDVALYVKSESLRHDNSPPPSTSPDPRVAELAALIDDLLEASRYVQVDPSHVQDCARRAKFRAQCLLENKGGGA